MPNVPCNHIADYYQHLWENQKCIAYNILRQGYKAWSEGTAVKYAFGMEANNLY